MHVEELQMRLQLFRTGPSEGETKEEELGTTATISLIEARLAELRSVVYRGGPHTQIFPRW